MPIRRYARKPRASRSARMARSRIGRARYAAAMRRRRIRRPLPMAGFPARKVVRMRYATRVNLNPGADGVPVVRGFLANGMFDPDTALGGHQPMGFDQWMAIYNHFTVLGSKITVRYVPNTTTSFAPIAFGVMLTDDNTFPYTGTQALEFIMESKHGGRNLRLASTSNSATSRGLSVTRTFSAKRFFGTRALIGEDTYRGTSAGDPAETANFLVWACNPTTAGNDPPNCSFVVTIDYIAMLTERREITPS